MPLGRMTQNEMVAEQIEPNGTLLEQQELGQMEQGEEVALIEAEQMVLDEFVFGQAYLLKVSFPSVEGAVEVEKSWNQPGLG